MPSSISSSNDRIPPLPYGRILSMALACCLVFAGALTWFENVRKQLPSVGDSHLYWGLHRDKVYSENGRKKVVIVGLSRSQSGLDPRIMADSLQTHDVVMLSLGGVLSQQLVVKDLAEDPRFDGYVLFDTKEQWMLPQDTAAVASYLKYYHQEFSHGGIFEKRINARLKVALQERSVLFSPVSRVYRLIWNKLFLGDPWACSRMRADRSRQIWFADSQQYLAHVLAAPMDHYRSKPEDADTLLFREIPAELNALHRQLKARGGGLILLRMPSSGVIAQYEEEAYPKARYWDAIVKQAQVPAIHFADHAELRGFNCPDYSHLDATDIPEFTRRLSVVLAQVLGEL